MVDGAATLYVERGGRTALAFTDDPGLLEASAAALAEALRRGRAERMRVETVNGGNVYGSVLEPALRAAGFRETPRGLRFDARG